MGGEGVGPPPPLITTTTQEKHNMTTAVKAKANKNSTPAKRINILNRAWCDLSATIAGRQRIVPRAMDQKVSDEIAKKQAKVATKSSKDTARDFIDEAYSGLYRFEKIITDDDTGEEVTMGAPCEGTIYGIKAVALKKAVVRPFKTIDKYSMQDAKGGFHIEGPEGKVKDWRGRDDLIPIIAEPVKQLSYTEIEVAKMLDMTTAEMESAVHEAHLYGANMRDDIVRIQSGASIPRYRMEFNTWKIPFVVSFNRDWVSEEILINAIDRAGMEVGLCENRPEKSGDNWGTFQLVTK